MSQEKVNRYKEQKSNREQLEKKGKRKKLYERFITGAIVLAVAAWLGYSAYLEIAKPPIPVTKINANAITDFASALDQTEAEVDDKTEALTEEQEVSEEETKVQ